MSLSLLARRLRQLEERTAASDERSAESDELIDILPLAVRQSLLDALRKQLERAGLRERGNVTVLFEDFADLLPQDVRQQVEHTHRVVSVLPQDVREQLIRAVHEDRSNAWRAWDGVHTKTTPPAWEVGWLAGLPLDRLGLTVETRQLIEETIEGLSPRQ